MEGEASNAVSSDIDAIADVYGCAHAGGAQ